MKPYFNKKSFEFLSNITINNNKDFFEKNKHIYQEDIINPLKELIIDLQKFIFFIDNKLETKPVINKAISRIYRDARFSKKKRPFKNFIGFNFRKKNPDWDAKKKLTECCQQPIDHEVLNVFKKSDWEHIEEHIKQQIEGGA